MDINKLYVIPLDKVVLPQSVLHDIFLEDEVSEAYSDFKKKGYVRKLSRLIKTLAISDIPNVQEHLPAEDIITTYLIRTALETVLFAEGEGDIKKSLVYLMSQSSWLKIIDEEYESFQKAVRENTEKSNAAKQKPDTGSNKPVFH